MKCWFCNEELIWQCDYVFEDYEIDDEGIISVLFCPKCEAFWEGYLKIKNENSNK